MALGMGNYHRKLLVCVIQGDICKRQNIPTSGPGTVATAALGAAVAVSSASSNRFATFGPLSSAPRTMTTQSGC